MNVSNLALRRAKKQLDTFCLQQSTAGNELACLSDSDSLVLQCNRQVLVRIKLDGAQWHVFWLREDGQWTSWPHLPVCDDIQQVIEQLEQAPLHVHWSG